MMKFGLSIYIFKIWFVYPKKIDFQANKIDFSNWSGNDIYWETNIERTNKILLSLN